MGILSKNFCPLTNTPDYRLILMFIFEFHQFTNQVPGAVLQGVPDPARARPPLHLSLHAHARHRDPRTPVHRRRRLPPQDARGRKERERGVGILPQAAQRCARRRVDHENGLAVSRAQAWNLTTECRYA